MRRNLYLTDKLVENEKERMNTYHTVSIHRVL